MDRRHKAILAANLRRLVPRPYTAFAQRVGLKLQNLSGYLHGKEPDAATLAAIARELHVSAAPASALVRGESPGAKAADPAPAQTPFVASNQRGPFHMPICQWARRISPANRVEFASREEALAAGHTPCRICQP